MKKKHKHKKFHHKHKKGHRNAAPVAAAPRRRVRMPRRADPPDFKTTIAAVAGGAGGAALGGLVVNQNILSPEAVGVGMIGLGGATAWFAGGRTRVVGNSVAAAGAGQLALALMARKALALRKADGAAPERQPVAALPPAPLELESGAPSRMEAPPRRRSASDGFVRDLFNHAQVDIADWKEDEWRFGTRDSDDAGEADVYDVELEAA
jgi:hypothetical protein